MKNSFMWQPIPYGNSSWIKCILVHIYSWCICTDIFQWVVQLSEEGRMTDEMIRKRASLNQVLYVTSLTFLLSVSHVMHVMTL